MFALIPWIVLAGCLVTVAIATGVTDSRRWFRNPQVYLAMIYAVTTVWAGIQFPSPAPFLIPLEIAMAGLAVVITAWYVFMVLDNCRPRT